MLSRVVEHRRGSFGRRGLAESMGISYARAEGIKVGHGETRSNPHSKSLLTPLGRELRVLD